MRIFMILPAISFHGAPVLWTMRRKIVRQMDDRKRFLQIRFLLDGIQLKSILLTEARIMAKEVILPLTFPQGLAANLHLPIIDPMQVSPIPPPTSRRLLPTPAPILTVRFQRGAGTSATERLRQTKIQATPMHLKERTRLHSP